MRFTWSRRRVAEPGAPFPYLPAVRLASDDEKRAKTESLSPETEGSIGGREREGPRGRFFHRISLTRPPSSLSPLSVAPLESRCGHGTRARKRKTRRDAEYPRGEGNRRGDPDGTRHRLSSFLARSSPPFPRSFVGVPRVEGEESDGRIPL